MHAVRSTRPQPLAAIRGVELGGLAAASYTARLFADFGAEVIKVEPPAGDALRRAAPLLRGAEDGLASGWFAWLNAGKRSVAADLARAEEARRLRALIGGADVLIDSLSPAQRTQAGVDHAALRAANPRLIVIDLSWFGHDGEYAQFKGTDAICRALAGLVQLTGPREGPPLVLAEYQAAITAGLAAFVPLAASLYARAEGGAAWQMNVMEASVTLAELQSVESMAAGVPQPRLGLNRYASTFPMGVYPCKEGWLGITILTPAQWHDFCELLGLHELADDPRLHNGAARLQHADLIDGRVPGALLQRTAQEWFEEGLRRRLPFVVVPTTADLLESEHFRQRGMLVDFQVGEQTFAAPGLPWKLAATPPQAGGQVPVLNEAAGLWRALDAAPAPVPAATAPVDNLAVAQPLTGVRVVDLSMGWAGPLCTRQLADLGAEVIKIESCGYTDWWRGTSIQPEDFAARLYEKSARFGVMNRNKHGITLDLTSPEGVRLVKELVQDADIVVENYSNGVLRKLGLDYPVLREVKPDLIMVSMSAFGSGSELSECRAYGSTLEQGSGLPSVSGRPEDPPVMNHIAYGDAVGGLNGAGAVLLALLHRQQTGEGQNIDMSQVECMMPYLATWVLAHAANGAAPPRLGNQHPDYAPHGIYPCAGDDSWLLIAVTDDAMWRALCHLLQRPDLTEDPAFSSADGRRRQAARIDGIITEWTRERGADDAMFTLQKGGVAAGVVRAPFDLGAEPHLVSRGFWQACERPYLERHLQPSAPFRPGPEPLPVRWVAPTLGQHNEAVLGQGLGLAPAALQALQASGVIGTEAYPAARFVRQKTESTT